MVRTQFLTLTILLCGGAVQRANAQGISPGISPAKLGTQLGNVLR